MRSRREGLFILGKAKLGGLCIAALQVLCSGIAKPDAARCDRRKNTVAG